MHVRVQSWVIWGTIIHTAKSNHKKNLRPQRNLWSFDLMLGCLVILTATFFLLTIYSILQENAILLPVQATRFLSLKILDTSSAASLFVTLLGALLVRHQFALGLRPRIIYKSTNSTRNNTSHPDASFETWRVEIRNSGLGAAIINNTSYELELPDIKSSSSAASHQNITIKLAKAGLVRNSDYWLENITTGFALSPKDDCLVFEIKMEHRSKINRLDMVLYFQSQLGDKYWQKIHFIPREIDRQDKQVL